MKNDFLVSVLKPAAGFGLGLQILVGALAPVVGVDAGDRLAWFWWWGVPSCDGGRLASPTGA
jgi:hypothetical protein